MQVVVYASLFARLPCQLAEPAGRDPPVPVRRLGLLQCQPLFDRQQTRFLQMVQSREAAFDHRRRRLSNQTEAHVTTR